MRFTHTQSKATALGLLSLCLAFTWIFLLSPLLAALRAEQQQYRQNVERWSRYQSLQADADVVAESVSNIDGYAAPVYTGPNTSSILAAMQRDIGHLAGTSGVSVGSIRPLNNSELTTEGLQRLELHVDLTGTTRQLSDFIAEIRQHRELMVFRRATLRAIDNGSATLAASISMTFELNAFGSTGQ